MKQIKMLGLMLSVLIVTFPVVTVQASENSIFDDQFSDQTLNSGWVISPGRGSYSLTDNPGYLRYIIDANHVDPSGGGGWDKAMRLVRPFSGDQWILKTVMFYNMRPGAPTNNRETILSISAPSEIWSADQIYIFRTVGVNDNNLGSNVLYFGAFGNDHIVYFPNSPNPLPIERWYFEIERNKDHVAIRASNDGNDATFEYEFEFPLTSGSLGNDQEVRILGWGWYGSNTPPGYVDFDYIKVVPTIITATINIDPHSLNLMSNGNRITAYIELPAGYDVNNIDTTKVDLVTPSGYTVPIDPSAPATVGNYDGDSFLDLMVKFDRATVVRYLGETDVATDVTGSDYEIALKITGELTDGTLFEGTDTIRVINKGK